MSSEIEHIEYDRDINPYPSFGKKYNGEKAIISMTSWKMRIATCSKTIYSLLKQCPGFHIVLVLSEEEFPKMMDELPENLKMFVDNELIEVLWVYKNYKSLKKILFTMDKYKDLPIISADDDLQYICNYAEELYNLYLNNTNKICTCQAKPPLHTAGPCTLYYPKCFGENVIEEMLSNKHLDVYMYSDDGYYEVLRYKYKTQIAYLPNHDIFKTTNSPMPLQNIYGRNGFLNNLRKIQSDDCGCDMSFLSS